MESFLPNVKNKLTPHVKQNNYKKMKRRFTLMALILSMFWVGTLAQVTSPCDLMLVPEEDNLCVMEKRAMNYSWVRACRGGVSVYRAYSPSAVSYTWDVVGGTWTLSEDGTICTIVWGDGDAGMVQVVAMRNDSTTCEGYSHVELLDKPVIGLVSSPNYVVDPSSPKDKWIEVCAWDTIILTDNSTNGGLPIAEYYWESPYGISSSRTFSFVANTPDDSYDIIHRAYNECGCYDEEIIKIIIKDKCPVKFSCYGAVCGNSDATYTIEEPNFSEYNWSITGGQLLPPTNGRTVHVHWNTPESGYGTLYLDGTFSECECKSRKSIRIPVISGDVPISGTDTICVGDSYEFSLPLWGATEYTWSVSNPANVILDPDANIVSVRALQTGSYTLTATVECAFLNCGPYTIRKTIVVKDILSITPDSPEVCAGSEVTFNADPNSVSYWSVEQNNQVVYSTTGVTMTYTFDNSGLYTVYAQNSNFCNRASQVVRVTDRPSSPYVTSGPTNVCPNSTYTYTAASAAPGCYILWEWIDDNGTQQYSGTKVNITFGSVLHDINVYQVNRTTGCMSEPTVYHVQTLQLAPWPYNSIIKICPYQQRTLSSLVDQSSNGVIYRWTVIPTNAISIQDSGMAAKVKLLANYTDGSVVEAKIILMRQWCGGVQYDTVIAHVGEIDPPTIIPPDEICVNRSNEFTVANWEEADQEDSYWYISSNSFIPVGEIGHFPHFDPFDRINRIYGVPAYISFPNAQSYDVHLHFVVSQGGCWADTMIQVSPVNCPGTAEPGCINVEDAFQVVTHCRYTIVSIEDLLPGCGLEYPFTLTVRKNGRIILVTEVTGPTQHIMIPENGECDFSVGWSVDGQCYVHTVTVNLTGTVPDISLKNNCDGRLAVTAPFNTTVRVTPLDNVGASQSVNFNGLFSPSSILITMPATGRYAVRFIFSRIPNSDCYLDSIIYFDNTPLTIDNINISPNVCENTAYIFHVGVLGVAPFTYEWDFGDGSSNRGNDIKHVYDYREIAANVQLTVTDDNGCSISMRQPVTVHHDNTVSYTLTVSSEPQCPDDPAVLVTNDALGNTYLWSPSGLSTTYTANVYNSGDYSVTVTTPIGCRKKMKRNVAYPNAPFAAIIHDDNYCQGDVVKLYGDVGSNYTYTWVVTKPDGSSMTLTDANPQFNANQHGDYYVVLTVSDGTCSSNANANFHVHKKPDLPTLSLCGNSCITNGPVDVCSDDGRDLHWSNGMRGPVVPYYYAGEVSAYYIDPVTGCKSDIKRTEIPKAPDFDGFLSGCYRFCYDNMPDKMLIYSLGVNNSSPFDLEWYYFEDPIHATSLPPVPADLPIVGDGEYHLKVNYSHSPEECEVFSPLFTIAGVDCKPNNPNNPGYTSPLVIVDPKVTCEVNHCDIIYVIHGQLCNLSGESIRIEEVQSGNSTMAEPVNPFEIGPGECIDIEYSVVCNQNAPEVIYLMFIGPEGTPVGYFYYNFYDWLYCLNLDSCNMNITPYIELEQTSPNQTVYLQFQLGLGVAGAVGSVPAIWCDQGRILESDYSGGIYYGRLMVDYGLLSQLTANGGSFCFHVICCYEDKMCIQDICVSYSDLWNVVQTGEPYGRIPEGGHQGGPKGGTKNINTTNGSNSTSQVQTSYTKLALDPNPATGTVSVCDATTRVPVADVVSVDVISMQGQVVLTVTGSGRLDISNLSVGSYIVKVVTGDGSCDYLKLIKK